MAGEGGKLEVVGITKTFRGKSYGEVVLSDLSLYADEGEFVSIIGPSGSGKSTLFHMIGGILRPDRGRIVLDGTDITGRRGQISYMPQHDTLLPWRTVLDNVTLEAEIAGGRSRREAKETARAWLDKVGLAGYEKAYPHVLSGGMRQRAAFVRALMSPRQVMCLDEPFAALDSLTRLDMQRWLLSIWEQNKRTVLLVTHSIEEALLLSDRIYVLTPKPTGVKEVIRVPFARPRSGELTRSPEFIELREQIYGLLEKEAGGGP